MDAQGLCKVACQSDSTCLLTETCQSGICVATTFELPTVVLLTAAPLTVLSGETATIRYLVQGADRVEMLVITPDVPNGTASDLGSEEAGTQGISRITQDTTVRIEAWKGEVLGFKEVTIQVRQVGNDVAITEFKSDADMITAGEAVTLSWQTVNAAQVTLSANGRVVNGSLAAADTFADQPLVDTTYRLVAEGPGGPAQRELTVAVVVESGDGPHVTDIGLTPASRTIREGDNAVLWWSAVDAERVLVAAGQNVEYLTQQPELIGNGAWLVSPGPGQHQFKVRAEAQNEMPSELRKTLTVQPRPERPTIVSLSVSPDVFAPDREQQPVTVTWQVQPETADVELVWGNGGRYVTTGSGQHTVTVRAEATIRFDLNVYAPEGLSETRPAFALAGEAEEENNDLRNRSNALTDQVRIGNFYETDGTPRDFVDWYEVSVPQDGGMYVAVDFLAGPGGQAPCPQSLVLEVFDRNLGGQLAVDRTANGLACRDISLVELPAGLYKVKLSLPVAGNEIVVEPYGIAAITFGPRCGNGAVQAGESCDDGETQFGRECTPGCEFAESHDYETSEDTEASASIPQGASHPIFEGYGQGDPSDAGYATVELPFEFPFFGRTFHGVGIFTDGYVSFLPRGANAPFEPSDFAGEVFPNAVIAAFAADLKIGPGGAVRTWVQATAEGKRFIIDFDGFVSAQQPGGGTVSAQIQIYENGDMAVVYRELNVGPTLLIEAGIEGPDGRIGYLPAGCSQQGCVPQELTGRRFWFSKE